jgi:hypothetical protein
MLMNLALIKKEIELYKSYIKSSNYDELYKWEALKNFQDNWDIEKNDFRTVYDKSFYSRYGNNLWANPHWFPKAVMLKLIDHDEERAREMFRNLFNEKEVIDKRIEQFVFHCDRILEEVYAKDKSVKNHFHDGQRIVSLYLAFRFPDKYAIYKYTEFKTFMEKVQATDIPGTGEYERFFKVVRTLFNKYLKVDAELMKIHNCLLTDECYKGETLMLAQDFIFTSARRYLS